MPWQCVKSVHIWSFSSPCFRKTPNTDTFHAVRVLWKRFILMKAHKKAYMNLCWYQEKELSHLRLRILCQMLPSKTGVFKGTPSGLRKILATDSPLKMIRKAFSFTLKAFFFFSRYLVFFVLTCWSVSKTARLKR